MFGGNMVAERERSTFISYSRVDKEFALRLAKELRSSGYPVWLDQLDIPTGSRWDDEVEKALQECSIFMIILTPGSITSMNVKDEIGFAIDHGKRILPVLVEKCQVPLRLSRFQYVDFTLKSFEDGVESAKQLLTSLMNESTQKRPSGEVLTALQDQDAQANVKAKTERTASQVTLIDRKSKEEAERPAGQTSVSRRTILILGLIVLVIGFIVIFSILQKSAAPAIEQTSTPVLTATSSSTPSPAFSENTNISVSGQAGSIGIVLFPDGQSRDLVNGIFAIPQDSRLAIMQKDASINLADGSGLYMSPGTVFIISRIQGGLELMLQQGSLMAKLATGAGPLSIRTQDGLVAQVSGSIMGVQLSLEPGGIYVDCYEGSCLVSGGAISDLRLEGPNRYIFYAAGSATPSDQTQRCEFWENAIGQETIQGLGQCSEQQAIATSTPTIGPTLAVNAEATQRCLNWLRDHHDRNTCP